MKISDIYNNYSNKLDLIDLDLLIAQAIGRPREFVLGHPEYLVSRTQQIAINNLIKRRLDGEPMAYLLGHKEFYGLDFSVDKNTLIPRPETELVVERVLQLIQDARYKIQDTSIVDIGTGSGNIIISIFKNLPFRQSSATCHFYATDISKEALKIARKNARAHGVDKKITFIKSDLLSALIQNTKYKIKNTPLVIVANLPYLSKEIYRSAPVDVKNFEPKSALYSPKAGLAHYEKLLKQIRTLTKNYKPQTINCFLEFSPEQKTPFNRLVKKIFPDAKIKFYKDLAGKWRMAEIVFGF